MVKVKSAVARKKRRGRVLKMAKGQYAHRSKHFSQAKRSVMRGLVYSYRDRKTRKREIKNVWIVRINAACREEGITYSRFIKALVDANVTINRKMLAEMAVNSPEAFLKLVEMAKKPASSKPSRKAVKQKPSDN